MPKALLPMMIPLEILGAVHAADHLCVRLYANMLAGHMLILVFIGLIFLTNWLVVPAPVVAARPSTSSKSLSSSRSRRTSSPPCPPSTSARPSSPNTRRKASCSLCSQRQPVTSSTPARRSRLALGIGLGSLGAGIGIGNIFGSMIQAVARQPELRGELQGIQWLGFALTEAVVFYGLIGGLLALRPDLMPLASPSSPTPRLIKVVPGLMIWTLIVFGITFFVLRRYAFGPIQTAIDKRRDRIREALDEADHARYGGGAARRRAPRRSQQARVEAEEMLAEARRVADAISTGVRKETRRRAPAPARGDAQGDRGRDAARARPDPHRGRDLTLEATEKVTGKLLTGDDQRRLIDQAIDELDFSALEKEPV